MPLGLNISRSNFISISRSWKNFTGTSCHLGIARSTEYRHPNQEMLPAVQQLEKTFPVEKKVQVSSPLEKKSFFPLQPVLCEASYALLEYAKTAMFMWMFIEGLFLHNMVTGESLNIHCKNLVTRVNENQNSKYGNRRNDTRYS